MGLELTFEVGSFNVKRTLPSGRGGGRWECATVHKSISVATMHSGRQGFGKHIGVIVGSRTILDHDATLGDQFTQLQVTTLDVPRPLAGTQIF